jgi:hypothetical protein
MNISQEPEAGVTDFVELAGHMYTRCCDFFKIVSCSLFFLLVESGHVLIKLGSD